MTTDTKVAELPAKWIERASKLRSYFSDDAAEALETAAAELQAALARQEADNASSPNVIYRWRALDYSGFCYGSNPPHDLPPKACLTAFYRDPEGLRSALHEISATGNLTATDKQFSRHLQEIARNALAGATPPAQAVDLPKWQQVKPKSPGIYAVRGFHYRHPNDYAVVEVVERGGELTCNLHQRTSEWPLSDRYDARIADMWDKFEWLFVAQPIDQQAGKGVDRE